MKLALLSNINADYILRILKKKIDCVSSVGYGNVWGQLLDPSSNLNNENPDTIVFLNDIEQLLDNCFDLRNAKKAIDEWFSMFDATFLQERDYFVSDVLFRSCLLIDNDSFVEHEIIQYWMKSLKDRIEAHSNVHLLRITETIQRIGKDVAFSNKMWFLGKIPYTNEGCKAVAGVIENSCLLLNKTTKKVLVLDLDNTLWGGILGEVGVEGIELSDDHIGAIYKKVQQQIKAIKDTGTIIALASKNNESDVQKVWDYHPHMILKKDDFVSIKINWKDKVDNILEIAKELNLGIDSFVFIDDMPAERDNVKMRLPEVSVPGFPNQIENYPKFIEEVYFQFFNRARLSIEDKEKTRLYAENALREKASIGKTYDDFLISLNLQAERVELSDARLDRIAQMHGKTNQFNLTTIRFTRHDIDVLLRKGCKVYAYNVRDKFGDYGIVAVAIVDCEKAEIISFLMSCRVMGKLIENYVINDIEKDLLTKGFSFLRAKYIRTAKNAPVEYLFEGLGYSVLLEKEGEKEYEIDLNNRPLRKFYVNEELEDNR